MNAMRSMRLAVTLAVGATLAVGCGAEPTQATSGDATGELLVALTATAGTSTYALTNATFVITGPSSTFSIVVGDPAAGDIVLSLPVGRYTVTLSEGWQIGRQDSAIDLVPVHAILQSANPITVSVFSGKTTVTTF